MKNIKLFMMDVDGVLTDAGMYYAQDGNEFKKFSTYDGKAVELLKKAGIKTAIITSENTKIVENRANKLKIDYLYQGVEDKVAVAREICRLEGIKLDQCAYIGDDINDIELLKIVGFASCPKNARRQVKNINNIIGLDSYGGDGAVRDFVDIILKEYK